MTAPLATADEIARFRDPGADFRMAGFWFWHRIPSARESAAQLADMRAKGIARVMIQARPALPIEDYLSPRYLEAYGNAARVARDLGLRFTIYDEYGWMSGHGGGRTVAGADHLRERHLFWTSGEAAADETVLTISGIHSGFLDFLGEAGQRWTHEGGAARWHDWQTVIAISGAGGRPERLDCPVTITPAGPCACRIVVRHGTHIAAGTPLTVFAAARAATSRLINYLLPEAAERFAAKVYAPLLTAAGGAADGFFFDHPYAGFYGWAERHGNLGSSLLWDETLLNAAPPDPVRFMALIDETLPGAAETRADFLADYTDRLHRAFFGTLSRWTRERGLGFAGHELLTHVGVWGLHSGLSGFDPRSMPGVDYFGIDGWRTETVADSADYAPQVSPRFAASIARANGRRRATVEQYSTGRPTGAPGLAGQWGLTAETFRAQAVRTILSGARQIILHALAVSDGAPGDGLLTARFDFPPSFNFLPWWEDCPALFTELARLSAFLEEGEPEVRTALFYPLRTIRVRGPHGLAGEHFGWWAEALARGGLGFDIVDERQLGDLAARGYDRLILPAADHLDRPGAIAAFAAAGGGIIASGPHLPGLHTAGQVETLDGTEAAVRARIAAFERPACDIRFDGPDGWSAIQQTETGWRLAAFNGGDGPQPVTIHSPLADAAAVRWDAASGTLVPLPAFRDRALRVELAAQELICLTLAATPAALPSCVPASGVPALGAAPAPITLDQGWTLEIAGTPPAPICTDRGWEVQGYPTFTGTGIYRREVSLPDLPEGFGWQLDLPGLRDTATLLIASRLLGPVLAGPRAFLLPPLRGAQVLELHVRNTAANRYYAGTAYWDGQPRPSGLTEPPRLVAVPLCPPFSRPACRA